jgi:septal ring factor EnvC (AmiA/AmiB activator)
VRLAALALALAAGTAAAAPKQDLESLRGRLEALRQELEATEGTRAEAADHLRDSERAISQTNRRLRELAAQRGGVQRALDDLGREAGNARGRLGRNQDALARLLHHRYVHGGAEPFRLALSGRDPNAFGRELRYLGYVSKARGEVIADLRESLRNMERIGERTRARGEELAVIEKSEAEQRKALEEEKATRREILEAVSAQVARQRRELATLKRDEDRLSKLVEKLAKAAAAPPPRQSAPVKARLDEPRLSSRAVPEATGGSDGAFRQLKGRLRLPVAGELAARFGSPREGAGISSKGVFIRARSGQDVRAVAPGRVVFADWLRGFGNLVIVDHGEGYLSLYGNNEALLHRAGDEVRTGEALATVGASGGAEESGLYFELRFRGKPFDPLSWARLN